MGKVLNLEMMGEEKLSIKRKDASGRKRNGLGNSMVGRNE